MGTVVIKTLTILQLMDAIVNGVRELSVDSIHSQSIHFVPLLYTLDSKLILEGIGWMDDKAIHGEQCLLENIVNTIHPADRHAYMNLGTGTIKPFLIESHSFKFSMFTVHIA